MLAADIGAEELELHLPVGMGLGELLPDGLEGRVLLGAGVIGRLSGVGPEGQDIGRVRVADAVGGHQLLGESARAS
jgi:hypothetical protein